MNKIINIYLGLCLFLFFIGINGAQAQLTYTDDFSTNTLSGGGYTTTGGLLGTIGTNNWYVARSGGDWGARRNPSTAQLELTNDSYADPNANGWGFAQTATQHHPVLDLNKDVTWSFNMRQSTADPYELQFAMLQ